MQTENDLKRIQLALGFVWSRNPCLLLAFCCRRNMTDRGLGMLSMHFPYRSSGDRSSGAIT
jgi:hypothetical protein